jgi:hypothetical protein
MTEWQKIENEMKPIDETIAKFCDELGIDKPF